MHRLTLTGLLLMLQLFAAGQSLPPDTVYTLEEVWVEASRRDDLSTGHPIYSIDSLTLQGMASQNLAFLLSRHSGMFIKSYGPSSLATTSIRGGSAAHTTLLWNGFSLQNSMHQQNDLSLMPVFFMDEVSIQHGGSSAFWGSGAMGGAIHLNNNPQSVKGLQLMAGLTGGSLHNFGQHLSLQYSQNSFSSSIKAFHNNALNRYNFVNSAISGFPVQEQQHAGSRHWGIMQENYLRVGSRHHLKLRLWLQDSERSIPPALQQQHNGAFQHDASLRIAGEWQSNFNRVVTVWRGGYFNEQLLYRDSLNNESISRSNTLLQDAELRWQMRPQWMLYSGLSLRHVKASNPSYSNVHTQGSLSVFSSVAWQNETASIKATASLRQEIIEDMQIPLVPSLGVSWMPFESFSLAANLGKNYRVPSLNDRFWIPGGNPDLMPESGWSQDLTAAWTPGESAKNNDLRHWNLVKKISATVFHRNINNWIIWLPRDGGQFWSPENIMEVQSYGLETRYGGGWKNNDLSLSWDVHWDYIIAQNTMGRSLNDASAGKQLIYVPKNRAGAGLVFSVKRISVTYNHQFTGRRYTASDNSHWLDPYHTADLSVAWSASMGRQQLQIFLSGINIWNESYFVMASRPMPLRYFEAGINIRFNQNN